MARTFKPKRNRKQFRKGRTRRHAWKKYGARAGSMAYTAYKTAMKLKDMINTEYKFTDDLLNGQLFDNNGLMLTFNDGITQGANDNQRVGDSIKNQSLTIRYYLANNAPGVPSMARVIVLWDPQVRITAVNQVLENTGTPLAPISAKLYDTRFQSRFLYDRIHNIYPDKPQDYVDIVIPVNLHTQYLAGSTTLTTGALRLILISNQVGAAAPSMTMFGRLTYTDN